VRPPFPQLVISAATTTLFFPVRPRSLGPASEAGGFWGGAPKIGGGKRKRIPFENAPQNNQKAKKVTEITFFFNSQLPAFFRWGKCQFLAKKNSSFFIWRGILDTAVSLS
jgi:hypothetical protein